MTLKDNASGRIILGALSKTVKNLGAKMYSCEGTVGQYVCTNGVVVQLADMDTCIVIHGIV